MIPDVEPPAFSVVSVDDVFSLFEFEEQDKIKPERITKIKVNNL
jgi:hypothetical protein